MINQNGKTLFIYPRSCVSILLIILLFSYTISNAQNTREEAPPLKERMFYGGSFSLQLGTITNIEISPVAGLWVLPRLGIAAGPTYRFYKYISDKTNIYGGRIYAQYVFFRDMDRIVPLGIHTSLFMHVEDEMLSLESKFWQNVSLKPKRFMINTVLAGAGLSQQIGEKASINIVVLWALNDSGYEIYSNPEVRFSFVF